MSEFEVTCITKPAHDSIHEQITHIGNAAAKWRLTVAEVIPRIEAKTDVFYLRDRATGMRSYIAVVREYGENPYLRAYASGMWNGRLLELPDCGPDCQTD